MRTNNDNISEATAPNLHCSEQIKAHRYYNLILDAVNTINERFPFGAFNQVENARLQNLSKSELEKCFLLGAAFSDEINPEDKRDIKRLADITQTQVLQNCGLSSDYALGYLKNKYPDVTLHAIYVGAAHHMLLIGGQISRNIILQESDLTAQTIAAWGNDAIVLDIWAKKSYFVQDILVEKQKETILYYNGTLVNNRLTEHNPVNNHYLSGTLEIFHNIHNDQYDNTVKAWVREDQRRFQLAKTKNTAPQTPLTVSTSINSSTLVSILSRLTGLNGWKAKSNIAWLESDTSECIERAVRSLELTKAAVVRSGKNPATGLFMVKCEHFELSTLERLSKAIVPQNHHQMQISYMLHR